jgi:hypothetical protein
MSERPRSTSTTASVAAPSPGPTCFLTGTLELGELEDEVDEDEDDEDDEDAEDCPKSVKYALRNTGPLSVVDRISL